MIEIHRNWAIYPYTMLVAMQRAKLTSPQLMILDAAVCTISFCLDFFIYEMGML